MVSKFSVLVSYCLPIVLLIGLIPFVGNGYMLACIYIFAIGMLYSIKTEQNDVAAILFSLVGITLSEYLFVSTGVETFTDHSFLGVMPLWLPFLWAYAFLTIKRVLRVLDR